MFSLRQQARPHLPPISAQELAQEKVATWSARDRQEVELPQVIIDLLLAQSATEEEWQSAIDLFGVIGLAGVLNYIEGLPAIRQYLNKQVSTAVASAQVKPSVQATTKQQVALTPGEN